MQVKSYNSLYDLVEFHHYVTQVEDNTVSVLELQLDCSIDDFDEDDFTSIFVIEDHKQTYVFSWYKVTEYYEENDGVKVVCIK